MLNLCWWFENSWFYFLFILLLLINSFGVGYLIKQKLHHISTLHKWHILNGVRHSCHVPLFLSHFLCDPLILSTWCIHWVVFGFDNTPKYSLSISFFQISLVLVFHLNFHQLIQLKLLLHHHEKQVDIRINCVDLEKNTVCS